MRVRGTVRGWKALSRVALIGLIGGGAAACSSDASRLGEPFSNPFSSLGGEPAATGSLGADGEAVPNSAPAIRTPRIKSEALAAPGPTMSPRAVPSAPPAAAAVSGMNPSGMNPDAGRASKPAAAAPAMTPRPGAAAPPTKLKFTQGAKPAEKAPERKAAEAKPAAKAPEPKQQAKAEPKHEKAEAKLDPKKAEALKKAEADSKAAKAEAAKKVAEAKAAETAAKASAKETKQAAREAPVPVKVASIEPTAPAAAPESNESFRWPAKGRVINGYGSSGNEGINIAVPEGTPVKAAEEGTVAYAGSDVKGYGKLVLVRHNNGYVSAYAHNGEIDVRPGEKVKRGQVIAKSGATGNVTSPQLHFEIRKGATPVDPIPHLAGN